MTFSVSAFRLVHRCKEGVACVNFVPYSLSSLDAAIVFSTALQSRRAHASQLLESCFFFNRHNFAGIH
jgi:hypothetical protein